MFFFGRQKSKSAALTILALVSMAMFLFGCSDDGVVDSTEVVSSRAYQGHASDVDINNFVKTHPSAVGTRLDDCQTCHKGGSGQ